MFKRIRSNTGSALLISLLLIGLLSLLGIMATDNSNTEMTLSYNESSQQSAFYVAEAGAKRAFIALKDSNAWRAGYANQGFGDGAFSVTIRDSVSVPALKDTVVIVAQGKVREAQAVVELWTVSEVLHPFTYGMFAGQWITFDRNGCTDSYASDSGTYAATLKTTDGSIGSNGAINIGKNVIVGGDAYTATGGSIALGTGAQVLGDTSTKKDSVNLDIIPQSEYDWAKTVSKATTGLSGTGYAYDAGTQALTTGASGTVTFQSGVYYFSSITLGALSNIIIAPNAQVTIYVTGNIQFGQTCKINGGGVPSNLQIWSKGSLGFDQGCSFYGTFYGPNGAIQYDQTTQVYGALVGKTIKLDQSACFHYDRSLSRTGHGAAGNMLAVAWRQI
jgi:Tfp pilus assembly protein PilX